MVSGRSRDQVTQLQFLKSACRKSGHICSFTSILCHLVWTYRRSTCSLQRAHERSFARKLAISSLSASSSDISKDVQSHSSLQSKPELCALRPIESQQLPPAPDTRIRRSHQAPIYPQSKAKTQPNMWKRQRGYLFKPILAIHIQVITLVTLTCKPSRSSGVYRAAALRG